MIRSGVRYIDDAGKKAAAPFPRTPIPASNQYQYNQIVPI